MHGLLHGRRRQLARDGAPALVARDQAGIGEDVEMLHHRGQRHPERLGQFADRHAVVLVEPRQQRTPRRVGERGEHAVERGAFGGIFILNHEVKYWAAPLRSQPAGCENFQRLAAVVPEKVRAASVRFD